MLLNAKPKEEEVVDLSELKADSPWWLSPPLHFLFFPPAILSYNHSGLRALHD